ncbi:MAG: hypothetical protein Q9174_003835 [Haloplaca sp. 1 TL-2023]
MEFVGVAASATTLLQSTADVLRYLAAVKGASKDRQRLLAELHSMEYLLCTLQERADEKAPPSSSSDLLPYGRTKEPLEQLEALIGIMTKKFEIREGRRRFLTVIAWPFKKDEIEGLLAQVARQKSLIDTYLNESQIRLSDAILNDITALGSKMIGLNEHLTRLSTKQDVARIQRWLEAPDPSLNYHSARSRRCEGTGSWFVGSETFRQWIVNPAMLVWLNGSPGCGKTFLSATILDHVFEYCSLLGSRAVLYYYFDFRNGRRQQHQAMIHSFVSQLSSQNDGPMEDLLRLHSTCYDGLNKPEYKDLMVILRQAFFKFQNIYIVLDALDECDELQDLLDTVKDITKWEPMNTHVLITSRDQRNIKESLALVNGDTRQICIQSKAIGEDIRRYILHTLNRNPRLRRWHRNTSTRKEIESALTSKADGMFRWVACQLDQLGKALSTFDIRGILATLPIDLERTYTRILSEVPEPYIGYISRVLKWLAFSTSGLSLDLVAEIVTVNIGEHPRVNLSKRFQDPVDLLDICPSMISCKDSVATGWSHLELAHFSVREYLLMDDANRKRNAQYGFREPEAHATIASDCIAYLLHLKGFILDEVYSSQCPLVFYAAWDWTEHAQVALAHNNVAVARLIDELFSAKPNVLRNWIISGTVSA